ncbi:MAG: bifunctional riboflavin kinase/FAD synthetase [Chloroflexi bacterium]|nr:bifunctional riboflavin kinase/FAD synthetase [Chloroflexota bacterium]
MQVEEELAAVSPDRDTLLTVGVFDGVHLGHKHLLSQLKELARQRDLLSGVVTFRQHPQEVLSPQTRLSFLSDLDQRARLLQNEGVEVVVVLSFTPELAQLGVRQFITLLRKHLRMRGLVVGPDFALGQGREGDINTLRKLGQEMDFSVTVVPPVIMGGEVVSSTAIRRALAEGNMKKVIALTGRPFSLHGRVVAGEGRGMKLGFPTANLDTDRKQALPADGIYATWAHVDDKVYQSVTNIGKRPTFNGSQRTVEVYLLDFDGNLYGRDMRIDIVERLRSEKRFDNVEALKKQMADDVKRGKSILDSYGGS